MEPFSIHPDTTVGPVDLAVADLDRAEQFYREVLGFRQLSRADGTLTLAADGAAELLILREQPGARPKPRRATGLYHFAILYPDRAALAAAVRRVLEHEVALEGASDHGVSEAVYLRDPDGNGIELYRDRPESEWPRAADGSIAMHTRPLDLPALLA